MNRNCRLSGMLSVIFTLLAFSINAEFYYKEIRKSIGVNNNVRLKLDVNFADINMQTWDQSQMEIVVKMDVKAGDQKRADEMFQSFSVEIKEGMDAVDLTVGAGNWTCNSWGKNSESYTVSIEIRMPLDAVAEGKVAFGDLVIGDMRGACKINAEYGDVKINGLWSYDNDMKVSFGDCTINGLNGGEFRNEYGDLELGLIQGKTEVKSSFGDLDIRKVAKECKDLKIEMDYADAKIKLAEDSGFKFDMRSSYGDIKTAGAMKKSVVKEDFSEKEIEGSYGTGEGILKIESDFGDVNIDIATP